MKKITFLFSVLLIIVSCEKDIESLPVEEVLEDLICESCGIDVTKEVSRLTQYNQVVNLSSQGGKNNSSKVSKTNNISLELKAKLAPLYINHNGEQVLLNANHVAVSGKRIAASYSLVGEPYSGAVDILNAPKGKDVNLQGTLLIPHRDIDAVTFINSQHILFGGGFDAREFYGGDYPSFFGRYKYQYNKKSEILSLREDQIFHSMFGNKLRSLKSNKGIVTGSGGGNSGIIFAFDEETNTIIKHDSSETQGLFILDTAIEKRGELYNFVAIAYDNLTKELMAFSYVISKQTDIMSFSYQVSLGTFDLNVEAKHSLTLPRKNVLAVSLGSGGLGIFKVNTNNDGSKFASLKHQLKGELLDPSNPNHVVNSFSYQADMFYVAAGEAGMYIIPYLPQVSKFDENFVHVAFDSNISVNSIGKSEDELVVATTEGLSIFTVSGL